MRLGLSLPLVAAVGAWLLATSAAAVASPEAQAIQRDIATLEAGTSLDAFGVSLRGGDLTAEFYRRRNFEPAWTEAKSVDRLLATVEASAAQGLDPDDYHQREIRAAGPAARRDAAASARFDLLLTHALVSLAYDVRYGRVPAAGFDPRSLRARPLLGADPAQDLEQAVDSGLLDEFVHRLEPPTLFYSRLQQALAEYRRLAAAGGWPVVPAGPSLKPGMRDARVPVLRERLAVTGDLPGGSDAEPGLYDGRVVDGVKAFQSRHGLDADGVLGAQTVAALGVPAAARVDQVRATLERTRWYLRDLPHRYVIVNAAGFRVLLIEDGQVKWRSRVIVGKPMTSTPMFRAEMRSVILNPTWTVPSSIVRNEMLPELRRDPNYLRKKHISVIDGQYVQAAGPDNALGRIKLNLPNPYSVYLHDTPSRALFERTTRAFSHGCVRVQDPVQLAALALDDPEWSVEALEAGIATGKTRSIVLKKPLTVFLLYWSVTVGADGRVEFLPDLYHRDEDVLRGLAAAG